MRLIEEFMRKWAAKCQKNPIVAILSLPFIIVFALYIAIRLFIKGDKRWREAI